MELEQNTKLQKNKKYTTQQQVQMLWDIMNDNISEIELREKVNQVPQEELMNREITIDRLRIPQTNTPFRLCS